MVGPMVAATLRRLDGTYTAYLAPPMLALVGKIPDALKLAYSTFIERYPGIPTAAFRILNTNVLAEAGISVSLLDNRLEVVLRVDQISARTANLTNDDEIRFAVDCILIINNVARKFAPDTTVGVTSINISSWSSVTGGAAATQRILAGVTKPAKPHFLKKLLLDASRIDFLPNIVFENSEEKWRFTLSAEKSAIAQADLFVARKYEFLPGTRYNDFEQQFAFVQKTTSMICDWLGIEVPRNAAG